MGSLILAHLVATGHKVNQTVTRSDMVFYINARAFMYALPIPEVTGTKKLSPTHKHKKTWFRQ